MTDDVPPLQFVVVNNYDEIESILSNSLSDANKPSMKIITHSEKSAGLNNLAKNFLAHNEDLDISNKIDLLSVGAAPTPHNKANLKKFLLSFGMAEDDAISALAVACKTPTFNGSNVFTAKIISDDIVLDNNILYSTNSLWVSNIQKSQELNFVKDIGAITPSQIQDLPTYHGGETFFQNVIFKKIFQDLLVSAIDTGCIFISIYPTDSSYKITSSNGMYSFDTTGVFSNTSMFDKFVKYVSEIKVDLIDDIPFDIIAGGDNGIPRDEAQHSSTILPMPPSRLMDNDKFQVDFELDDRVVNIIVETDNAGKSISFELIYKPIKNLCLFDSFSLPTAMELYSSVTIVSYERKITKDFFISELARELHKGGMPLFIYDDFAVSDWFQFRFKYHENWKNSSKVSQADILICCFTTDDAIASLNDVIMSGKSIILLTPGVSSLDTLKKVRRLQLQNIDSQLSSFHHFTPVPTTCPYCSKTKILNQPKRISTFIESNVFIPDSTEFIARNSCGCDKCVFGMTEILTFSESLYITPDFIESLCSKDSYRDDELIQKHSDSYFSATKHKLKAVLNKTIDPDDI